MLLFLLQSGWFDKLNYWISQSTGDWMPRAHCVDENPVVMTLHILSELLIALAYYSIPIMLIYFAKKQKTFLREYKSMIMLFGLFICLCGTTHLIGIAMFWYPTYWIDGAVKLITGIVSLFTAFVLLKALPKLLALATVGETKALMDANETLTVKNENLQEQLDILTKDTKRQIKNMLEHYTVLSAALDKEGFGKLQLDDTINDDDQ